MRKKKKATKKTMIGLSCLILAGLIMFVAVPVVTGLIGNTTKIVRVSQTIKVGEMITENNTEMVEVSQYNLPTNLIKDQNEVLGKYVTAKLESGDYILKEKIVDNMITSGNYMSTTDGNKEIVSVSIKDFAGGISGKIMAGDIVKIINNAEIINGRGKTYGELQYVKVLAITTANGVDQGGERVSSAEELPASVTLLVNSKQAELLAAIESSGNVYFTLVYRGEEKTANEFLQRQNDYFTNNNSI